MTVDRHGDGPGSALGARRRPGLPARAGGHGVRAVRPRRRLTHAHPAAPTAVPASASPSSHAIVTAHGGSVSLDSAPGLHHDHESRCSAAIADLSQTPHRAATAGRCQSGSSRWVHDLRDLRARPRRAPHRPSPADTRVHAPGTPSGRGPRRPVPRACRPRGPRRAARRHRPAVPVGARRIGLGQLLLLRRRPGRVGVVEGVLLRLLRRREQHHRRQDTAGDLADGPVGPDLRAVVVEHPRAAGARRRGRGLAAARDGPAYDGIRGRRPDRGRRDGADAGRGADVPLQQPRRDARASCWSPRRTPPCGPSSLVSTPAVAPAGGSRSPGALVGLAFLAKMLQAFLVLPALVLVYAVFAGRRRGGAGSCTCSPRSPGCSSPRAGGSPS